MNFIQLKREDFGDDWEHDCCRQDRQGLLPPEQANPVKSTVEQWLDSTWLRNTSRNGVWVPAMACYTHYVAWMARKALAPVMTANKFGRVMKKLCSSKRGNAGRFYLLEKRL